MDDFTTTYHPDSYQFLRISSDNEDSTVIKLFAVWHAGYLTATSWRMNSGVTKIEVDTTFDNLYIISGYSGSQYVVNKDSTKPSSYGQGVLRDITEKAAKQGIIVQRISLEEAILEMLEWNSKT